MAKDKRSSPKEITPSPENPRWMSNEALAALKKSLSRYGDISGFVFNVKTGRLVGGHQRLRCFARDYEVHVTERFDRPTKIGTVGHGHVMCKKTGERFAYREVDWPASKEREANLAANNPHLQGKFTPAVKDVISEILQESPDVFDMFSLGDLGSLSFEGLELDEEAPDDDGRKKSDGPATMELQPFENYDYVVFFATTIQDWQFLCAKLGLERVNSSPVEAKKKIGIGRVLPARRLIELIQKAEGGEFGGIKL